MLVLVVILAIGAAWRIVIIILGDAALQRGDVDSALRWQPNRPEALLQRAEALQATHQLKAASDAASLLLKVEPSNGRAYRVLAQVAASGGDKARARALYATAARLAPRDLTARAWLAQDAMERADFDDALIQIDQVLILAPRAQATVFPVLVQLSADPVFADALVEVLRNEPPWRAGMLTALRAAKGESRDGAARVFGALQRKGGFATDEIEAWTESLMREGRWGEAYARWAAPLVAMGRPIPLLYNGDFESESTGTGFDWRQPATPGLIRDYESGIGTGRAVHLRFLGRRVVGVFLEHALLLPPGQYVMRVNQRTGALRSDYGLQWAVTCADDAAMKLASSKLADGSRSWNVVEVSFSVPAGGDCMGQWLRLANAGASGAGQLASGDVWIDSVTIVREHALQPEREAGNLASAR